MEDQPVRNKEPRAQEEGLVSRTGVPGCRIYLRNVNMNVNRLLWAECIVEKAEKSSLESTHSRVRNRGGAEEKAKDEYQETGNRTRRDVCFRSF